MAGAMTCLDCSAALGPKNKTGLCRRCGTIRFNKREGAGAQISATLTRKYRTDPVYRERNAAHLRAIVQRPEVKAAKSAAMKAGRIWEMSRPFMEAGSLARQRAGRAIRENLLGWCPFELRGEYRSLIKSKKIPAAEARRIILEQHETELARFRRSIGAAW